MKTIKLLLAATLIMVGVSLNAQDNPFTFGVKAGLNMSNMNGDVSDNKVRFGYNIGVTLDYAINQDWYILSGLQYTTKGMNGKDKASLHAAYLQLPIHAGYKLEVTPATTLVFHAGPYLAYGTNGDVSSKDDGVKVSISTFDYLKRFDAGLGLGIGAEFGKIALDLGWDFGLVNVIKDADGVSARNGNAYLTVGYKF